MTIVETAPWLEFVAYGEPGPQGSKNGRPVYKGRGKARVFTGKVAQVESSAKVKPWRAAVAEAARQAMADAGHAELLDGQIVAQMVFTVRTKPKSRPDWWPAGLAWSRHLWWLCASTPDLSKLIRSTEDAMTGVVWADDARVVRYRETAKTYALDPREPDSLPEPGAVVRVWAIPALERVDD
ncbi:RusA family crossover junction endodeoxyribonuclease [Nonomuraea sp. K274]|uniref:RusA family crossover junction endodeoxyribonuclease n=1 Tax=Nonomuraea cypriaca TaxID=1187855 RepID=A0A931A4Y1_9ACTN|nr:RusA family crossover junction endodeoxyribonuclease [Nonomuraea cypriaca]MBF8186357.1 RusA family crossover junction endodeoxyribonuclease [Nonomuraea cypriaca]